ncbi:MFS transporter [Dactylosporangium siamense]|uniref:MFS transporter n=1 Tax=Dactylosporangium siamense TaxID=685454 RepID=A0A919PN48_9ACTN|nr:MFS transporter [Dactylosporangium siamense]GIG47024.1 MFS transporter [Dactylosporangium siamense]
MTLLTRRVAMPAVLSVLLSRRAFPVACSSLIARLPKGITPLAVVILIHQTTGSYAIAGAIAAGTAFGDALTTPVQGRLLDRFGRGAVLIPSAMVYAVALALLPLLALRHAPTAAVLACALLAGSGFPPISGSMKALWPRLVTDTVAVGTAYAAESLIQQILLLIAPLLASALITWFAPAAALWAAAAATLLGTVSFVAFAARVDAGTAPGPHRPGSALRVPAIRLLVAATLVQGLIFGALPVVLSGLAAHAGAPDVAGLLLAAWICGGVLGSFRASRAAFPSALARLAAALAAPAVVAAVTGGRLVPVALAFGVAGLFLTPVAAASYVIVDDTAPPGRRTEAFTWLSTALAVGGSAGSALAGASIDGLGILPAVFLPTAAAGLAALVATRLRR